MEVKKATTEIFQKEFPTGGSHPSLFDCSDGFRYVVKHSQQKQNYKHLINELIAAQLAKVVSVPIPDFALIEIKNTIIPSDYLFSVGKPSGLGFGSQFLSGSVKTVTSIETIVIFSKSKRNEIIENLVKICAFDIWLRNIDRTPIHPNLLMQETRNIVRLFAIDHSSIFSELNYFSLSREINESPAIGENLIDKELFSNIYFKYGLFFDKIKQDICGKISSITDKQIQEILDNIPVEWNLSVNEKEEIFNFIYKRKTKVEEQFNLLLKEIGL